MERSVFHAILKAGIVFVICGAVLFYGVNLWGTQSAKEEAAKYEAVKQKRQEDFRRAIVEIDRQSASGSSHVQPE